MTSAEACLALLVALVVAFIASVASAIALRFLRAPSRIRPGRW